MKRLLAACVTAALVVTGSIALAGESDLDAIFARGNEAYEAGDYGLAIDHYSDLVERGVVDADLFYNLGNACFESGEMGRAVLWYERARRVAPRDDDVRANLALTRSLLRDQQLVPAENGFRNAVLVWHRKTTASESVVIASGFYLLLSVLAILFVFRREPRVGAFLRKASIFSPGRLFGLDVAQDTILAMCVVFLAGAMFAGSSIHKLRMERERQHGVIVAGEVSVFSGPSRDATVQFKIHEGTSVSVRESRPGWVRVDLPGDLGGWVDAGALERI